MRQLIKSILFFCLVTILFTACSKKHEEKRAIKKVHKTYSNGCISECELEDELVYIAGANAYDAGSVIFDKIGQQIASCNYAWGTPDSLCYDTKNCELVYCIPDNIWGWEAIDKYKLGYKKK